MTALLLCLFIFYTVNNKIGFIIFGRINITFFIVILVIRYVYAEHIDVITDIYATVNHSIRCIISEFAGNVVVNNIYLSVIYSEIQHAAVTVCS